LKRDPLPFGEYVLGHCVYPILSAPGAALLHTERQFPIERQDASDEASGPL
jgi:hypothetical protein